MGESSASEKLDFANRSFTDRDLDSLPLRDVTYPYREVDFSQNQLSTESLHKVLKLCLLCGELKVLKLYKNGIDDEGARVLANFFRQCGNIEEVHLSHNSFTAEGVSAIVEAAENSRPAGASPLWLRLEQNDVEDAPKVLQQLQQRFSVCGRRDRWKCTVRACIRGCKVHLPHFRFQRAAGEAEQRPGRGGRRGARGRGGGEAWAAEESWGHDAGSWWQSGDAGWGDGDESWQQPWGRKRAWAEQGEDDFDDDADVAPWRNPEAGRRLRRKLSSGAHAPGGGAGGAGGLFARAMGAAIAPGAGDASAAGRRAGGAGSGRPEPAPAALPSPRRSPPRRSPPRRGASTPRRGTSPPRRGGGEARRGSPARPRRCSSRTPPRRQGPGGAAAAAREAAASTRSSGGGAAAREREEPRSSKKTQDLRPSKAAEASPHASRRQRRAPSPGGAGAGGAGHGGHRGEASPHASRRQRRAPSPGGAGAGGAGHGGHRGEAMRRALQGVSQTGGEAARGAAGGDGGRRSRRRIRITNVPPELSAQDIAEAFQDNTGKVKSCEILDGIALVEFFKAEDAEKAVSFDNGELNNRIIRVTLAS